MSSQWSYGPNGLQTKPPAAPRWTLASEWLRWRDLQPLLLRSAGVVGLAGLTITLITSNAFVGSKPRAGATPAMVSAASELPASGAPALAAAPETTGAIARVIPVSLAPSDEAAVPAPADPQPIALQPAPEPIAPAPATRTAETPPASAPVDAPAAQQRPAMNAPGPMPMQMASLEPGEIRGRMSPAWEEDAVICPRDWVVAIDANGAGDESCQPIGTVIASLEDDDVALRSAIQERAEQVAALSPRMPAARPLVAPTPAPDAATEAAAPEPAAEAPAKPRRVSARNNDWPAAPPPDCGAGKHAKWRFTDRATGTKVWYCK